MTANKYPNADTSPERLAYLEDYYFYDGPSGRLPLNEFDQTHLVVRDLVAMLQERGSTLQAALDALTLARSERNSAEAKLHDQRWRRFGEQMPEVFPIQVQFNTDDPPMHIYSLGSLPQVYINGSWWRPVPPLPKE